VAGPAINVSINGDESDLKKAFRGAGDAVNGFGGTFKRTFNTIVAGGLFGAIDTAVRNTFSFAQSGTKQFDALGDSLTLVDANVKGLSKTVEGLDLTKLGFDKLETSKAAVTITGMAKALGLTGKATKKMTPGLLTAAAAFSALTGKDPATAADTIAKALGGSAKAAKALGIEFKKGETPAQRYADIMKKFGPLAKDAADGTRTLTDEQDTLDAKMADLSTTLGGFVNDALLPIVTALNNNVLPAFAGLATFIKTSLLPFLALVGDTIGAGLAPFAPAIQGIADAFGSVPTNVLDSLTTFFKWMKANGKVTTAILGALGAVVLLSVVPPFVAWAAATVIALAPLVLLVAAVAGLILLLDQTGQLAPVLQTLSDIFNDTLLPAVQQVANWFSQNLPGAIATAADFFNNTLLPAIQSVADWISVNLAPRIAFIAGWLGDNLPKAIGVAAQFFNDVLIPALQAVAGFIVNNVLPAVGQFSAWINDTAIPAIQNLAGWINDNLGPILATLADVFQNVVLPAAQALFGFIIDTVLPKLGEFLGILGDIATLVSGALTSAFNDLKGPLQTVTDILNNVLGLISNVLGAIANAPFLKDILGFVGGGGGSAGGAFSSVAPAASAASNLLAGPSGAQSVAARVGTASAGDTFNVTIQTTGDSLAIERAVNRAMTRNARLNGGVVVPVRV
jgi:phage-related protein